MSMQIRRVGGAQAEGAKRLGLVKIDRVSAKRLWETKAPIGLVLVGSNVNDYHFFGGWHLALSIDLADPRYADTTFDAYVNNFEFYLEPELGRHASFFVKKTDLDKVAQMAKGGGGSNMVPGRSYYATSAWGRPGGGGGATAGARARKASAVRADFKEAFAAIDELRRTSRDPNPASEARVMIQSAETACGAGKHHSPSFCRSSLLAARKALSIYVRPPANRRDFTKQDARNAQAAIHEISELLAATS